MKYRILFRSLLYAPTLLFLTQSISSFSQADHAPACSENAGHSGAVFEELLLIDDQTVFVPTRKTLEVEIQQRFGTMDKGAGDLYGLYAPSNTRVGVYYVPVKRLMIGAGLTKEHMQLGLEAKYNFVKQDKFPLTVTYFMNGSLEMEPAAAEHSYKDRLSFFHQLLIGREFKKTGIQIGPSLSHFNRIAYSNDEKEIFDTTTFHHFSLSFLGEYRFRKHFGLIAGFDQPITHHAMSDPYPNLSLGILVIKEPYCLQVFVQNYYQIESQSSHMFNRNDFKKGEFLLGFNLSRSWHFGKSGK